MGPEMRRRISEGPGRLGEQVSLGGSCMLRLSSSILSTPPGLPAVPQPADSYLGLRALAHTKHWKKVLSICTVAPGVLWIQRDEQSQGARVRFLRDFRELDMEGQRGHRARTRQGCSPGRMKPVLQPREVLGCMFANRKAKQFLSPRLPLFVVDEGGGECSVCVSVCVCVRLCVYVCWAHCCFLNM